MITLDVKEEKEKERKKRKKKKERKNDREVESERWNVSPGCNSER